MQVEMKLYIFLVFSSCVPNCNIEMQIENRDGTVEQELMAECSDCGQLLSGIVEFAECLMRDDLANCRRMGRHCAEAILKQSCGRAGH